MAYRVLKNAGYVPEEVQLRREIGELAQLLALAVEDSLEYRDGMARLRLLVQRLGETRGGHLAVQDHYGRKLAERFRGKRTPPAE